MRYRADRVARENIEYANELKKMIEKTYLGSLTAPSCCLIREFSWLYDLCSLIASIAGKYPGETIIDIGGKNE